MPLLLMYFYWWTDFFILSSQFWFSAANHRSGYGRQAETSIMTVLPSSCYSWRLRGAHWWVPRWLCCLREEGRHLRVWWALRRRCVISISIYIEGKGEENWMTVYYYCILFDMIWFTILYSYTILYFTILYLLYSYTILNTTYIYEASINFTRYPDYSISV